MIAMGPNSPITAPAAAAAARTPWNHFRRRWAEWMVGRPEDLLIAGLWTASGEPAPRSTSACCCCSCLPAGIGLGLGPPDATGRFVLVAAALAAVFSASEVEVQRRSRGVALLPVIAGLVYGLAVSAVFAAVLWADAAGRLDAARHRRS